MNRTGRVTEAWTRSTDPALAVTRDQIVRVEKESHGWAGRFWCLDANGPT